MCLVRVVRRVMLLSRCVPLTGRSWRPSAAISAAWRSVTWRCLRAPLRRWTSCWWEERLTGAASRRHHVSYDVSAAGLWDCFSQLCVRVGGASRLPVFSPFSHSFTYSCIHLVGVLAIFPVQTGMGIRSSRNLVGWMFYFIFCFWLNLDLMSLSDAFLQRGNEGLWFGVIQWNLSKSKCAQNFNPHHKATNCTFKRMVCHEI